MQRSISNTQPGVAQRTIDRTSIAIAFDGVIPMLRNFDFRLMSEC